MDLNKLHEIDEQLTQDEVAALKFLCMDLIGRKRLETVKDAKDLFIRLVEQDLLKNELFLPDLLFTIGRIDLLSILETDEINVRMQRQDSGVSEYRKMLYMLSEDVTEENLHNMKFLLNRLPKAKLVSATILDVLADMEKMEMLGENKLDELENILNKTSRELSSKVQEFKNKRQRILPGGQEESMPVQEQSRSEQHEESMSEQQSMHVQEEESLSQLTINETNNSLSSSGGETNVDTDASANEDDCYSIKHRPVGYCLIINNFNFAASSSLSNRRGTEADRDQLEKVFERMHFTVKTKEDQKRSDMLKVMEIFSLMDHSKMDVFVCCILSHGQKGSVFGTDGKPVLIREITQLFTRCQTLRGKPKLFFIQACQGNKFQDGVWKADGLEEDEVQSDAESDNLEYIPIEADFLIGMATVESYKSFRHTMNGAIYIQELCIQLVDGCGRNEDILSILTKVNRNVSKRNLNKHKQMPEPRYTLTKKLVLPID